MPHLAGIMAADCPLARIGGRYPPPRDFGAWSFCQFANNSEIFSVGIGNDATFDWSAARRYGARVSSFDPTISHKTYENLMVDPKVGAKPTPLTAEERSLLRFFPFGLAAVSDVLPFWRRTNYAVMASIRPFAGKPHPPSLMAPVMTLPVLMALAGVHRVDILKVDIEGAEVGLFSDPAARAWLCDRRAPPQIGVEFHTRNSTANNMELDALRSCGYVLRLEEKPQNTFLMVRTSLHQKHGE
tara:strand:+ start:3017 stop:3742 length:726 start_codon:yes stop_codon:yes gene_type:complete